MCISLKLILFQNDDLIRMYYYPPYISLARFLSLFESSLMNREIILRVRAPDGQYRINIMSRDTYGELLLKVNYLLLSWLRNLVFPSRISWSRERMES